MTYFPQLEHEQLEKQMQEALRRTLVTAGETCEISQRTAEELNGQTEQLYRIKEDTERIKNNLDTSQYLIAGMKSWWGSMIQMFTAPPIALPGKPVGPSISSSDETVDCRLPSSSRTKNGHRSLATQNDKTSPALSNNRKSEFDVRLESDLSQLSGMLGEIHARAVEMNHTINYQNTLLEDVTRNVDSNQIKMKKQRKDIEDLIGRK